MAHLLGELLRTSRCHNNVTVDEICKHSISEPTNMNSVAKHKNAAKKIKPGGLSGDQ